MWMPSKAPFEARRMEISGILWFFMIFLLSVFKNSLRGKRRKMRGATMNIIPHPDGFCNPGLKKIPKKQLVNLQFILRTQANEKKLCKIAEKRNFVIDNREKIWYNGLRNEQTECHWNRFACFTENFRKMRCFFYENEKSAGARYGRTDGHRADARD